MNLLSVKHVLLLYNGCILHDYHVINSTVESHLDIFVLLVWTPHSSSFLGGSPPLWFIWPGPIQHQKHVLFEVLLIHRILFRILRFFMCSPLEQSLCESTPTPLFEFWVHHHSILWLPPLPLGPIVVGFLTCYYNLWYLYPLPSRKI